MQLRDGRASEFTKIPLPIGEAYAGVLLNYLRFVEPDDSDTNKSRWPMKDYWQNLVGSAQKIRIFTAPGMEYNEERCKRYVVNQAGNAIDAMIQMYGIEEFQTMIDNRDTIHNPKYDLLIQCHRFEVLADKVQRWFTVEDDPPYVPPDLPPAIDDL